MDYIWPNYCLKFVDSQSILCTIALVRQKRPASEVLTGCRTQARPRGMGSNFDNFSTTAGLEPDGFQPGSARRKAEMLTSEAARPSMMTRREAPC
jgi:hypothetical protein